ncbi:myosin heavy chain, non-muscle-like isoform X2 [Bacillus rossius redtenbacheri]|uniref:myosin heavy chain, non-muscle-like isoform X2 n=1 Tax=Bacillus rossius redtenbacheri TaxID=93214 RepID=UPI002FDEBBE2
MIEVKFLKKRNIMDSLPQTNQDEKVCVSKTDWFSFEQKFMAAVQELKLKRVQLTEARQDVQEMMMQNHEKDSLLDQERHAVCELRISLSMMTETVQKWEEERKALADAATRSKASLDIAVAERDLLQGKVRDLQLEVVRLRGRAEEQEAKLCCQQDLQSSSTQALALLSTTTDQLKGHMNKVKEDHGRISKRFQKTNELAGKLKLVASQLASLDANHTRQVKILEEKLIASNVELDALKAGKLQKLSSDDEVVKENFVREWEESLREMRDRVASQMETIAQLNATLGVGVEAQRDLQASDARLRAELEAERAAHHRLKARSETSAEQLRVAQQALQQERELHKRPDCMDLSTQTVVQGCADKIVMTDAPALSATTTQEQVTGVAVMEPDIKTEQEERMVHVDCEEMCCQPTQVKH